MNPRLLHRPLGLLAAAAIVVAVLVSGSLVYAAVRATTTAAPPVNDALAAASTVLATDPSFAGDTTGATAEAGETAGAGQGTVWFSWAGDQAGTTYLVASGATTPDVHVFTGTGYPLTAVPVDSSGGSASFVAQPGRAYLIQVAATSAQAGPFQFQLWQPTPGSGPDNDSFDNAASLDAQANALGSGAGSLASGTLSGASREDGEPGTKPATVWYSWVVPNTGAALHVTATGGVTLAAYRLPTPQAQPAATGSADPTPVPQPGLGDLVVVSAPTAGQAQLSGSAGTIIRLQVSGDAQAFTLSGSVTGLVAPDVTAPVVSCTAVAGWGTTGKADCTASDAGSGLDDPADATFVLKATVPEGTASSDAMTESRSVCDKAGNCTTAGPVGGLQLDRAGPDVSCQAQTVGWTGSSPAKVDCTSSDADSGLANTADASFTLQATTAAGTADQKAAYSTHAQVCDTVGNCTDVAVPDPASIDRVAPVVHCAAAPTGWLAEEDSITCTAKDVGSGLADDGDATIQLVTTVGDASASANASTEPRSVCDQVGNCTGIASVTGLKVDRALPAISCVQPPSWSRGASLPITCTATDQGSGLAAADKAFTLTASVPAGTAGVAAISTRRVCDLAGNCIAAPAPSSVGLDDQRPTVRCQSTPGDWQLQQVTVSCTAEDGSGSGLAQAADGAFDLTADIPDGTVGTQVALPSRSVCDLAGNCTSTPAFGTGRIDRVMPKAVCTVPSGPFSVEVTVTCVASDVGSGLADPGHATFTLRTDVGAGNHDAAAETSTRQVCDVAGNCITAGPVGPFDVDRSQPAPGSAPTLHVPAVVHVLAARPGSSDLTSWSVPVPFSQPTAVSEIGAEVGCTPDLGGAFPVGSTVVTCTARDGADRTTDAAFDVDVVPAPDLAPTGPIWAGGGIRYAGRGYAGGVGSVRVELDGVRVASATPAQGVVKGSFLIPAGTALGSHLVVLRGTGTDGAPRLVVMPVTLSDDPADAEGLVRPGLSVWVSPKRDRRAPYQFVATATLTGLQQCAGTLVGTVKAQLLVKGKAVWRIVGPTRTVAVHACTTRLRLSVSSSKLRTAVRRTRIPVRVRVLSVDPTRTIRVARTVTVMVK